MIDDKSIEYLKRHQHATAGWWPYRAGLGESTEATALCAVACRKDEGARRGALGYLLKRQLADGGWTTAPGAGDADWTSALAAITLQILKQDLFRSTVTDSVFSQQLENGLQKATNFLLRSRMDLYDNRTKLLMMLMHGGPDYDYVRGWSWTEHTYNWVEPTSYALLALKLGGQEGDRRARQIIDLAHQYLFSKVCKGGGWNYGCANVLHTDLAPMPMPTNLALIALQDLKNDAKVKEAVAYLSDGGQTDPAQRSLLARAWSILSLDSQTEEVGDRVSELSGQMRADGSFDDNLPLSAVATIAARLGKDGNPFKLGAAKS